MGSAEARYTNSIFNVDQKFSISALSQLSPVDDLRLGSQGQEATTRIRLAIRIDGLGLHKPITSWFVAVDGRIARGSGSIRSKPAQGGAHAFEGPNRDYAALRRSTRRIGRAALVGRGRIGTDAGH
jgi:hypothetical protein